MTKLERLKHEATADAALLGHTMERFVMIAAHRAAANCSQCGRRAYVETQAEPGYVEKHGAALSVHCAVPSSGNSPSPAVEPLRVLSDVAPRPHPLEFLRG